MGKKNDDGLSPLGCFAIFALIAAFCPGIVFAMALCYVVPLSSLDSIPVIIVFSAVFYISLYAVLHHYAEGTEMIGIFSIMAVQGVLFCLQGCGENRTPGPFCEFFSSMTDHRLSTYGDSSFVVFFFAAIYIIVILWALYVMIRYYGNPV